MNRRGAIIGILGLALGLLLLATCFLVGLRHIWPRIRARIEDPVPTVVVEVEAETQPPQREMEVATPSPSVATTVAPTMPVVAAIT